MRSPAVVVLSLLIAHGTVWGAPAAAVQSITVEATLKTMSKVPTLKDLDTYQESLIAYEWQVDKVVKGTLADKTIIVYHWSFMARQFQAAVTWKVGGTLWGQTRRSRWTVSGLAGRERCRFRSAKKTPCPLPSMSIRVCPCLPAPPP